jgi:hypothetical protein
MAERHEDISVRTLSEEEAKALESGEVMEDGTLRPGRRRRRRTRKEASHFVRQMPEVWIETTGTVSLVCGFVAVVAWHLWHLNEIERSRTKGWVVFSNERAKKFGISRKVRRTSLKLLAKAGLLEVKQTGKKAPRIRIPSRWRKRLKK